MAEDSSQVAIRPAKNEVRQEVVVTDVHMRFTSMVIFMLKWSIAAIPAVVILVALAAIFWTMAVAALIGTSAAVNAVSTSSTRSAPDAKSIADSKAYIPNVLVKNVHVAETTLNEPGVFGEVKNNGPAL